MHNPLIAFDMGNVLLPFDHRLACDRVSDKCGVSADEVYSAVFKAGVQESFERGNLTGEQFTLEVSERLNHRFDPKWLRNAWSDIFSDDTEVLEIVTELSTKYELHLISNTNAWHFEHVLARFSVLQYFPERTLSYEANAFKPEPKMFSHITHCVTQNRKVLYIDDIQRYVEAAQALGALGHVFSSGRSLRTDLRRLGLI